MQKNHLGSEPADHDQSQNLPFNKNSGDFDADCFGLTLWKAILQDTESKGREQELRLKRQKGAKCEKLNNKR